MKKRSLLLFALLLSLASFACLNGEHYILKNGGWLYEDYKTPLPFGHNFYNGQYDENIKELDSLFNKTKDVAYLSDKGLILILQKKYKEALLLYQFIEKTEAGRYSTASNMGTLYELMGDNKNALYWIKKSVEINPKSHEGSEWLHVKILEAKINGAESFTGLFILETDFGTAGTPVTKLSDAELSRLEKSLFYQLNERTSFIKPKDPIVAVLMFELANIKFVKSKFWEAKEIYQKAKEYGYAGPITDKRIALAEEGMKNPPKKAKVSQAAKVTPGHEPETDYLKTGALLAAIVAAGGIAFYTLKRRSIA